MNDEIETEGPDAEEVVLQLLQQLAQKGKMKRAEGVLSPPQQAAPMGEASEEEMAELEAMLAEGGAPMAEGEAEMPCETCGKGAAECAC